MIESMSSLDQNAESYVRLTLALGEIDPNHVDAYFGPQAWRDEAKGSSLAHIIKQAEEARASITDVQIKQEPRAKFLSKQLDALIARAQLLNGKKFSFDEESAAIYDVVAPTHADSYYQGIVDQIKPLLPGEGSLSDRWEKYRLDFNIPPEKLEAVFTAGVDIARERTKKYIALPSSESFEIELVNKQVWGAYNWYKSNAHSLIQVNTDLPLAVNRILHLACHEGYPGHHVYNTLLEQHLAKGNGWIEFTIYPLYSPESLVAEGTAEYGADLCMPPSDRLRYEQEVLYPLAGLDPMRAEELNHISGLMIKLLDASDDAARRYLDGQTTKEQTIDWLQTYYLATPQRAAQNVAFFEANRSYIVTYRVGEHMVRRYVEANGKTTDEKWKIFSALLSAPTVPSDLLV